MLKIPLFLVFDNFALLFFFFRNLPMLVMHFSCILVARSSVVSSLAGNLLKGCMHVTFCSTQNGSLHLEVFQKNTEKCIIHCPKTPKVNITKWIIKVSQNPTHFRSDNYNTVQLSEGRRGSIGNPRKAQV